MKRFLSLFLIALAIGFMPMVSVAETLANQRDTTSTADEAGVRATVADLVRFQQDEDMMAFYDRMAPDARNLIPRGVWLSWTRLSPRLIPTELPEIANVTFDSWTWPVNGRTYDDVAIVQLTQTGSLNGADASQEHVLHFVKEDNRRRLLPLFSPWVASGAVATDGDASTYASPFDTPIYAEIDTFWAKNFAEAGLTYEPPRDLVSVTLNAQVSAGCGTKSDIMDWGIYYCTLDQTVYFSPDFHDEIIAKAGENAWNDIIAHEWGHHIQDLLNIDQSAQPELDNGFYTIKIELQADCLAGVFMQDQFASGAIDQSEVDEASAITSAAGDSPGTKWDDTSAHGTGKQRETSWQNGFDNGFGGCRLDLNA